MFSALHFAPFLMLQLRILHTIASPQKGMASLDLFSFMLARTRKAEAKRTMIPMIPEITTAIVINTVEYKPAAILLLPC
ncbi:MAG: hypothetical protein DSO00_07850 [Archaeoglobi archaeon]|nr:MAG: hypothetical protein DSO00_07850 [Archaeoglobi archaeon]